MVLVFNLPDDKKRQTALEAQFQQWLESTTNGYISRLLGNQIKDIWIGEEGPEGADSGIYMNPFEVHQNARVGYSFGCQEFFFDVGEKTFQIILGTLDGEHNFRNIFLIRAKGFLDLVVPPRKC